MRKVFIKKDKKCERLDKFLTSQMTSRSRNQIQKHIKAGRVSVNQKKVKKTAFSIDYDDRVTVDLEKKNEGGGDIIPQDIDLRIIHKDNNLLVLNKQSGIVVHPGVGVSDGTIINALRYHFPKIAVFGNKQNSGLINRLDKGTSGVLLVALNKKSLWAYSKQFEDRLVKKAYLTIVKGDWLNRYSNEKVKLISNYLGRNHKDRTKRAVVSASRGRIATSKVYFITSRKVKEEVFSFLLVQIMTGRTHQIRVHLSNLEFPILGDDTYGIGGYERLMLHSYFTQVRDFKGEKQNFIASIPDEFGKFFNLDKNSSKINSLVDKIKENK